MRIRNYQLLVSAITDQVLPANDDKAELKFLVNEKTEMTATEFDEKYGEEGYEVEYKYNFSKKINEKEAGTYKYAVEVKKDDVTIIPEGGVMAKDFVDFKLVAATKAVKVNALGLFKGNDVWEESTVMTDDGISIKVAEYENALGQKNTDKDENDKPVVESFEAPQIKEIVSSNPLIAYYDKDKIVVRKDGEVTFTVVFEDKDLEVLQETVKVTTKAKQKVTSIEAEDLKVKEGSSVTFDIKYFDQDGEEMREPNTVESFYTATLAGKEEAKTATEVKTHTFAEEGNYVVKVYEDADKKTELGSFKVQVVNVEGNPDAYDLEIPKNKEGKEEELIINVDSKEANTSIDLIVKAFIEEVEVDLPKKIKYEVKSSDEEVLKVSDINNGKITVTAKKEGTAKVVLYTVEGDLKEEVASIELEVKNTTEPITELTLKKDTKVMVPDSIKENQSEIKKAVVEAVEEEITVDQIDRVEAIENNNVVIVTITEDYGGKEFTLYAIFGEEAEALVEAEEAVKEAETKLEEAKKVVTDLGEKPEVTAEETKAVEDAKKAVEDKEAAIAEYESKKEKADQAVIDAETKLKEAKEAAENIQEDTDDETEKELLQAVKEAETKLEEAKKVVTNLGEKPEVTAEETKAVEDAKKAVEDKEAAIAEYESKKEKADQAVIDAEKKLADAKEALENLKK